MASSTIDLPWLDQTLGQPEYTAFRPTWFSDYFYPMTLAQRFYNTIQSHVDNARFRYYTDEVQNSLMRKYISPDIPPLHELEKNVVLALVNSFHSLTGVRPLTPGLIEVGGLHVQEHYKAMSQVNLSNFNYIFLFTYLVYANMREGASVHLCIPS